MLLKVTIFCASINAIFGDDTFNMADSVGDEVDAVDPSKETTEVLKSLTSDPDSTLDKTGLDINTDAAGDVFKETTDAFIPVSSDPDTTLDKTGLDINTDVVGDPFKETTDALIPIPSDPDISPDQTGIEISTGVVEDPFKETTDKLIPLPKDSDFTLDKTEREINNQVVAEQFKETTDELILISSNSDVTRDKTGIDIKSSVDDDLTSVTMQQSTSYKIVADLDVSMTTPVTPFVNKTNRLNTNDSKHNYFDKFTNTGNVGPKGITYGQWVGIPKQSVGLRWPSSVTSTKGGSNFGEIDWNHNIQTFPQRNLGFWKGTPYLGISDKNPAKQGSIFGNVYQVDYSTLFLGHGHQFDNPGATILGNMSGDMYPDVFTRRFRLDGSSSKTPITQEYSWGKWIPVRGSSMRNGQTVGNGNPVVYGRVFQNGYPRQTSG